MNTTEEPKSTLDVEKTKAVILKQVKSALENAVKLYEAKPMNEFSSLIVELEGAVRLIEKTNK